MESSTNRHSRQLDFYEAMSDFTTMFPSLEEEVYTTLFIISYLTVSLIISILYNMMLLHEMEMHVDELHSC